MNTNYDAHPFPTAIRAFFLFVCCYFQSNQISHLNEINGFDDTNFFPSENTQHLPIFD